MPLETTMICVDNSEWMRNGDYTPSRFEAQHDAGGSLAAPIRRCASMVLTARNRHSKHDLRHQDAAKPREHCGFRGNGGKRVGEIVCVSRAFLVLVFDVHRLRRPEVKVSPTEDMGKLLSCIPSIEISGTTSFVNAMQVAQVT